jgi:UDP-N-acetylglucosamine--N-acetylmuramyl-(pentapeptide) pyrophosphoryl-undecaprenol N-acetylglucosamine transferase
MPADQRPLVTHQTGTANLEEVKAAYVAAGLNPSRDADVVPFINNMAQRLADCDVILCRAGAITVSELCSAGVPSILVPLIVSTTDHQRANAEYMDQHGAAVHLPQSDLSPQKLAEQFTKLNRQDLLVMAKRARGLGRPKSAAAVADAIEALVKPAKKEASA